VIVKDQEVVRMKLRFWRRLMWVLMWEEGGIDVVYYTSDMQTRSVEDIQ